MKKALIISILFAQISYLNAQDSCKVLVKNLEGTYTGKCKKGFAHGYGKAVGIDEYTGFFKKGLPNGEGKYIWANGDVYDGEFKMGVKDGIGVFRSNSKGEVTEQDGVWKENAYKGPKPIQPKIIDKRNVVSVKFTKLLSNENRVIIKITRGNMPVKIEDLSIISSSGLEFTNNNTYGFQDTTYPFTCKVTYRCWNPLMTAQFECVLDFEIQQNGSWEVKIDN